MPPIIVWLLPVTAWLLSTIAWLLSTFAFWDVLILLVLFLGLTVSQFVIGRRVITRAYTILMSWACLLPLLAFSCVILVEYAFDFWYLQKPSQSLAPAGFTWATPATDSAAATRAANALYVIEMVDAALAAAVFVTVMHCLVTIYRSWGLTAWCHRIGLFALVALVAWGNYFLWFRLNPLENVLSSMLSDKADAILGLSATADYCLELGALSAIWLIAMTSGFVVAKETSQVKEIKAQLNQLTVLLYLAATVVILFMFVLGASSFAAAALLAPGQEGVGTLIRQLALAEALNFGVFWSLFLAAIHYPSVWAVLKKPCADRLEAKESPSPIGYYGQIVTTLSVLSPLILAVITKLVGSFVL